MSCLQLWIAAIPRVTIYTKYSIGIQLKHHVEHLPTCQNQYSHPLCNHYERIQQQSCHTTAPSPRSPTPPLPCWLAAEHGLRLLPLSVALVTLAPALVGALSTPSSITLPVTHHAKHWNNTLCGWNTNTASYPAAASPPETVLPATGPATMTWLGCHLPPLPPITQNDTYTGSQNINLVQNIDTDSQNSNQAEVLERPPPPKNPTSIKTWICSKKKTYTKLLEQPWKTRKYGHNSDFKQKKKGTSNKGTTLSKYIWTLKDDWNVNPCPNKIEWNC